MKRIKTFLDPEMEAKGFDRILSRVEVRLKDGTVLKKNSGPYKGGPQNPLSETELDQKFRICAGLALKQEKVSQALALLKEMERIENIKVLVSALVAN
jgi:2-methylcitrate dehydratase PrpD